MAIERSFERVVKFAQIVAAPQVFHRMLAGGQTRSRKTSPPTWRESSPRLNMARYTSDDLGSSAAQTAESASSEIWRLFSLC